MLRRFLRNGLVRSPGATQCGIRQQGACQHHVRLLLLVNLQIRMKPGCAGGEKFPVNRNAAAGKIERKRNELLGLEVRKVAHYPFVRHDEIDQPGGQAHQQHKREPYRPDDRHYSGKQEAIGADQRRFQRYLLHCPTRKLHYPSFTFTTNSFCAGPVAALKKNARPRIAASRSLVAFKAKPQIVSAGETGILPGLTGPYGR